MPIPTTTLEQYIAFRRHADAFYFNLVSNTEFLDAITSQNPDRDHMMDVLRNAGIYPDDEALRAAVADACMELGVEDENDSTAWDKLGRLATSLQAIPGPPWG